jgi:hypothetical protein
MRRDPSEDMRELERGRIRFYVRPRVGITTPLSLADVQSFFFFLVPRGGGPARRVRVGRKRMPDLRVRERCWAPVEAVGDLREMLDRLGPREYETKTRGLRHQAAAIELARGDYRVMRHGDHTHLFYELDADDEPSPLLGAVRLAAEGGCIAAVFNPEAKWRVRDADQPETPFSEPSIFEDDLQDRFGDRRFAPLEPAFLDHEGAELVLIGGRAPGSSPRDVDERLGRTSEQVALK